MSDQQALLRAVIENPLEDTPRLMYADWLDEFAAGESDRARAEFIRLECQRQHRWPIDNYREEELLRSKRLLQLHESEWRRPPCPECDGKGRIAFEMYVSGTPQKRPTVAVAGKEYDWAKCETCLGIGSCGPLSGRETGTWDEESGRVWGDWIHTVTWVRGFPVVACGLGEVWAKQRAKCSRCDGTGEVPSYTGMYRIGNQACPRCQQQKSVEVEDATPWAVAVVREGGSFEVTDAVVHPSGGNNTYYLGGLGSFPQEFWSKLESLPSPNAVRTVADAAITAVVARAAFPEVQS